MFSDLLNSSIFLKGTLILFRRSLIYLLLVFWFFLFILLNLQSIIYVCINFPTKINGCTLTLWLNLFHSFECFYYRDKIAFKKIWKHIFIFNRHEWKYSIFCGKFFLIVIVANYYLPQDIFRFFFLYFSRLFLNNLFLLLLDFLLLLFFFGRLLFDFLFFRCTIILLWWLGTIDL